MKKSIIILSLIIIQTGLFAGNINLKQFEQLGKLNRKSKIVDIYNEFSYPLGSDKNSDIKDLRFARYVCKLHYDSTKWGIRTASVPIEFYFNTGNIDQGELSGIKIYETENLSNENLMLFINKFLGGNQSFKFLNQKAAELEKAIDGKGKTESIDKKSKRLRYFDKENRITLIVDYDIASDYISEIQLLFTNDAKFTLPKERIYPYENHSSITILKGNKYKFRVAVPNNKYEYSKSSSEREVYSGNNEPYVRVSGYKDSYCPEYCSLGAVNISWKPYINKGEDYNFEDYEKKTLADGCFVFKGHATIKKTDGTTYESYLIIAVLTKDKSKSDAKIWVAAQLEFNKENKKMKQIADTFFDSFELKN